MSLGCLALPRVSGRGSPQADGEADAWGGEAFDGEGAAEAPTVVTMGWVKHPREMGG